MDASTRRSIESVKDELQSIINELEDISAGVLTDFSGIGNDRCSKGITKVAEQYRWVKRQIDNI